MIGLLGAALEAVLGGLFLLFIPGFAWCLLLFRNEKMEVPEIAAMSVALSVSLSTLSILSLNLLLGIEITLINAWIILLIFTAIPVSILVKKGNDLSYLREKFYSRFNRKK